MYKILAEGASSVGAGRKSGDCGSGAERRPDFATDGGGLQLDDARDDADRRCIHAEGIRGDDQGCGFPENRIDASNHWTRPADRRL